uniref:Uncharacterized protein n=1 Tax=Arundo donax TaxID=35708 RepID=A0A0A9D9T8_ARUDO
MAFPIESPHRRYPSCTRELLPQPKVCKSSLAASRICYSQPQVTQEEEPHRIYRLSADNHKDKLLSQYFLQFTLPFM